jgi:hypothetical protein
MTLTETLLILAHLADPTPHTGYGWRVDEQLTDRDTAHTKLCTLTYGTPAYWHAHDSRAAAEAKLAVLFDVPLRGLPEIDDDWALGDLELPAQPVMAAADEPAELLTCEACERRADDRAFVAWKHGEIDDQICDECLAVQQDTARWDAYNAAAYYHR